MDGTLTLLPKLFVNRMVKNGWENISKLWLSGLDVAD